MSADPTPVLPDETPFEWSERVLKKYDAQRWPTVASLRRELAKPTSPPRSEHQDYYLARLVDVLADLPQKLKEGNQ